MKPRFFKTPRAFRTWLEKNHETATELWVGFHRKATGKPSITWPQSVDEALCFGWIDGIRKSIDEESYVIRFTPRRKTSKWSAVNVRRVGELTAAGLMKKAGLAAVEARDASKAPYSYEKRVAILAPAYARRFKANRKAWSFFNSQAPYYQRMLTDWVMSAKQEETRARRLAKLIEASAKGTRLL
jgi:uncharacterized protein YdeI (YjbR/CyaY-like superfamily)